MKELERLAEAGLLALRARSDQRRARLREARDLVRVERGRPRELVSSA